jgi:hypothetical protein
MSAVMGIQRAQRHVHQHFGVAALRSRMVETRHKAADMTPKRLVGGLQAVISAVVALRSRMVMTRH